MFFDRNPTSFTKHQTLELHLMVESKLGDIQWEMYAKSRFNFDPKTFQKSAFEKLGKRQQYANLDEGPGVQL